MGHILSEGPHINAIVCHPEEEDTMLTEETGGLGWIDFILKLKPKRVVDAYGKSGESITIQFLFS